MFQISYKGSMLETPPCCNSPSPLYALSNITDPGMSNKPHQIYGSNGKPIAGGQLFYTSLNDPSYQHSQLDVNSSMALGLDTDSYVDPYTSSEPDLTSSTSSEPNFHQDSSSYLASLHFELETACQTLNTTQQALTNTQYTLKQTEHELHAVQKELLTSQQAVIRLTEENTKK
jgi:hypothetical protein